MYLYDKDLEFIRFCSNEDLDMLHDYILKDRHGNFRLGEMLTVKDLYKQNYPNHHLYWKDLLEEFQKYGGNTFANIFRKTGVPYRKILIDVCNKMKVNFNEKSKIEVIEEKLFDKILIDTLDNMSDEDIQRLARELNCTNIKGKQSVIMAFQAIFKSGGFKSYQLLVIVANALAKTVLGRGLSFTTNALLTKGASILVGPIGWTITGLWTAVDIAGPAYRVTLPSCIQIAYMRKKYNCSKEYDLETGEKLITI
ncbi:DUF3944 domain-containing protein [Clostridium perfringens]|uniref:DUF3944 domain-containing protein n=1 Tax=Clostridium perfringens TaxID=1502 RepID=UPI001C852335|nr:DUF3944 domain-containing protein [Clostridium perfringens]MDK0573165.1 DUF3944 domain-containing protein [Clostridium perfringens]MDK0918378.1 DUF3944 domain-containing protein [Clostridium perfringens]